MTLRGFKEQPNESIPINMSTNYRTMLLGPNSVPIA